MPRLKGPPVPRALIPRRFYSIDEFCDVAGVCRASVYNGMRRGEIPFVELTGRRRIPVSYVDALASKAGAAE
jgi:Helix-turn-helix domain